MDSNIGDIAKELSTVFNEQHKIEEKLNGYIELVHSSETNLNQGKTFLNQLLDQQLKLKASVQEAKLNSDLIVNRAHSLEESIKALSAKIATYEDTLKSAREQNIKLLDRFEEETEEIRRLFFQAVSNYATDQLTAEIETCHIGSSTTSEDMNILHTNVELNVEMDDVNEDIEGCLNMDFDLKKELLENLMEECIKSQASKQQLLEEKMKLDDLLEG